MFARVAQCIARKKLRPQRGHLAMGGSNGGGRWWRSGKRGEDGKGGPRTLTWMFLARLAYLRVLRVSSYESDDGDTLAIIMVLVLPPSESWQRRGMGRKGRGRREGGGVPATKRNQSAVVRLSSEVVLPAVAAPVLPLEFGVPTTSGGLRATGYEGDFLSGMTPLIKTHHLRRRRGERRCAVQTNVVPDYAPRPIPPHHGAGGGREGRGGTVTLVDGDRL